MYSESKVCMELLEIINDQQKMIKKQNKMIERLANENMEKENMLNSLAAELDID